jgi:hypothetical protein
MAQSNTQPVVLLVDASELKLNQWQSAVEAYPGFGTLGVTFVHAPYSEEVRYSFSKGTENIALVVLGDENLPYGGTFDEPFPYHHYPTTVIVAEELYRFDYSGIIIAAAPDREYCMEIERAAGNVKTINSFGDRAVIPSLISGALQDIYGQSK